MPPNARTFRELVVDLIAWGETVERSLRRTDRDAIMQDEQAELALARAVEIVDEISGRLLTGFPEHWRDDDRNELRNAYRMRNRLAHGYDDVAPRRLFDIARNDVARLIERARTWFAEIDNHVP